MIKKSKLSRTEKVLLGLFIVPSTSFFIMLMVYFTAQLMVLGGFSELKECYSAIAIWEGVNIVWLLMAILIAGAAKLYEIMEKL